MPAPHTPNIRRRIAELSPNTALAYRKLRRWYRRCLDQSGRQHNVAMFHIGRCGSTATSDLLRQHPAFHWGAEIFEDMSPEYYSMNDDLRAYQRVADSMYMKPCRYYGFETKYLPEQHLRTELANMEMASYLDMLHTLGFEHFILLQRRNFLKQAVSTQIGYETKQWSTYQKPEKSPRVTIDPEGFVSYGKSMNLIEYFENIEVGYAALKDLLSDKPTLELVYEADIEPDSTIAYKKICQFLNTPPTEVVVRLQRQNPRPITDLVENFSVIEKYLSGTEYEWMLAG